MISSLGFFFVKKIFCKIILICSEQKKYLPTYSTKTTDIFEKNSKDFKSKTTLADKLCTKKIQMF